MVKLSAILTHRKTHLPPPHTQETGLMPCPKVKSSESMTGESIAQETGEGAALLKSVIKDQASSSHTALSGLFWMEG